MADARATLKTYIRELAALRGDTRGGVRRAARELNVSHAAVFAWLKGRSVPREAFREAIERWSGGRVKATAWRLSAPEKAAVEKASKVQAVDDGPHAD